MVASTFHRSQNRCFARSDSVLPLTCLIISVVMLHTSLQDCEPRSGLREASRRLEFPPTPKALLRHLAIAASRRPPRGPEALPLPLTVDRCPLLGGRGVSVGPILSSSASDIFCDNENGPNFLFHNQGDGTFVDAAASAGECDRCPASLDAPGPPPGCPAPSSVAHRPQGEWDK